MLSKNIQRGFHIFGSLKLLRPFSTAIDAEMVKMIIDSHFIRVKINLAGQDPLWFSFDSSVTNEELSEVLLKQNLIKKVQILDIPDEKNLYLNINGQNYMFQNFKMLQKAREYLSENPKPVAVQDILENFGADLEDRLKAANKQEFTPDQIKTFMTECLRLFSNDIFKKEEIPLAITLQKIREELNTLEAKKAIVDYRAHARTRFFFTLLSGTIFSQLTLSYYGIFMVDWLGWDLIQPLTYTVSQGTFVALLLYWLRYSEDTSYQKMDESLTNSAKIKFYRKRDFDYQRYMYLQREENRLSREIQVLENKQLHGFRKFE